MAVLRSVYLWVYAHKLPFFRHPLGDSEIYLAWARNIAAGDILNPPVFYRAPLYAYFLAGMLKLAPGTLTPIYVVQSLAGLTTLFLVYLIARRLFDDRTALLSLLLAGLAGILPFFESKLVSATWMVLLVTLGTWLIVSSRPAGRWWRWLLAGLAFGVGGLAWPGALAIALAAVLFGIWNRAAGWQQVLAMIAGCLLALLPAAAHNFLVGHDLVLTSSNGGFTLYQGNNRLAVGTLAHPPEVYEWQRAGRYATGIADQEQFERSFAEDQAGRQLRPSEISGFWFGRALSWLRGHPGSYGLLLLRKLFLALSNHESPSNYNFDLEQKEVWPLRIIFVPFCLLLALGMVGLLTSRLRNSWPVAAVVIGTAAVLLAFYVSARYRVTMIPMLAVLGGAGLTAVYARIRARKRWLGHAALGTVLLFLSAAAATLPLGRGTSLLLGDGYRNLGEVLQYRAGDRAGAMRAYERASRLYEQNVNPRSLQEITARDEINQLRAALSAGLGRSQAAPTESAKLLAEAKRVLAQGDTAAALASMNRALAADPQARQVYLALGTLLGALGRHPEALSVFETGTACFPKDPVLLYNLALAALKTGDATTALSAVDTVLSIVPDHQWARELKQKAENLVRSRRSP